MSSLFAFFRCPLCRSRSVLMGQHAEQGPDPPSYCQWTSGRTIAYGETGKRTFAGACLECLLACLCAANGPIEGSLSVAFAQKSVPAGEHALLT